MRRGAVALALGAAALLLAATAAPADPTRIAVVRPAHPDAVTGEAATRLQAELVAAGFTVILVDAEAGRDPRAEVEAAAASARPAATVTIVRDAAGTAAEVWVADHLSRKTLVRRIDGDAAAESGRPAALAIRAVELLRASLLETSAAVVAAPPAAPPPPEPTPPAAPPDSPPRRSPRRRALLERITVELGLTAFYGLGDTAGRLAPTMRFAYGTGTGLAGRLTVMGPTGTDQLALVEIVYGFDRSWQVIAPVGGAGPGGCHTHLDDTATRRAPRLRTEAWGGVLSASAGVAARVTDRAAFIADGHALLVLPGPGAVVATVPAGGKPQLLVTASLGVVAGF